MTQQISDLVINLDVDSARFADQTAKIKKQLKDIADESDKLQSKINKSVERQIAALQRMGDIGIHMVSDIQEKQSAAADAIVDDWGKITRAVEETHRRIAEFNQQLQESGNLAATTGNPLQDIGVTLADKSGLIDKLMTLRGLGIASVVSGITASVYGLGRAWYEGSQESVEFNKQLILTGNYAGKTAGQLAELAKSIAGSKSSQATVAAVLAEVIGSGSFNETQIESITRAAVAMQEATGKSVDETIKNFQKLYDTPTKGSAELNAQTHYLTVAQFEYISALERRGDKEAAGQAAADAYSRAEQQRSQQILDNLGLVERAALVARNAFKGMWDELLNIGRPTAPQDMLAQKQQQLSELEKKLLPERQRMGYGYSYDTSAQNQEYDARRKTQLAAIDSLKTQVSSLMQAKTLQDDLNSALEKGRKINNDAIDAQIVINRYLESGTTVVEKRKRAYAELDEAIAANAKAAQAGVATLLSPEEIAKARAGIEKLYKVPKTAKAKGYVTPACAHAKEPELSGDQAVAQEQLNKRRDRAANYVAQMVEKQSALAGSAVMSNRLAGREATFAQLRSDWKNAGGGMDDGDLQRQLRATQDYYAEEDRLRGDWQAGLQKSWADYADNATNTYEQMKSAGAFALNGLSAQLTTFVTTGKSSFQDFTVSMLSMLTEILVKMALVNGVKGIAGAFGWGGLITNANGGVYNSASLSAYSGTIVDRPTFFAFAKGGGVMGEAGPEAILPLRRGTNGKLGVVAGNVGTANPVFNNTIIIQSDGATSAKSSGGDDGMSKAMMRMLDNFCQNTIAQAIRPGGQIFNAMKSR